MQKYTVLKLIGLSILVMIVLILISVLEVTVYSYLIDPGHETAFYESHAEESAPWVSGIFGCLLFFLIVKHWAGKRYDNLKQLVLLFPLTYTLLDICVLLLAGMNNWSDFIIIFVLANAAKFMGSYLGYRLGK